MKLLKHILQPLDMGRRAFVLTALCVIVAQLAVILWLTGVYKTPVWHAEV